MKRTAFIVTILALLAACSSHRQVTRLPSDTVTDLSGRWNDTDAKLVAQEMVGDALARVWLTDFMTNSGRKPVVTVGTVRNLSSEHIDTDIFSGDFERELINSGKVRFVASRPQRDEIREERRDQQENASIETMKRFGREIGADFILLGSVNSITDQLEDKSVIFYQTNFELVNLESNEKVWIGSKEIKKGISQGKTKW